VLDIAGDAASASGELHRDLVSAVAVMVGPEPTDVRPIINAMIERTGRAEAKLAEATRQAQRLRDDLNALDNDTLQDRLTGLLDRVAMERRLATAAAGPIGYLVAIIDIDGFRAINDEYGHAVGDRVLKAVAETLSSRCSPHPIARWQGGRFIILFEGISAPDVFQMIDNARQALAKRRMKLRENDTPLGMISFSAGIVSSRSRKTAVILDAAARLVRGTKGCGRNTVMMEKVAVGL
jgi:diguanylate cyclase